MISRVMCCKFCYDKLAEKNEKAANLWLNMCRIYTQNRGSFGIKNFETKELKILEKNGYLISNEDDEFIVIKLKGYNRDSFENEIYCISPEDHSSSE